MLNKTANEPVARVEMKLSISQPAEIDRARDLILKTLVQIEGALAEPPPEAYIDSLGAAGGVNFTCHFFVDTPRAASRMRSAGYFAVLDALRDANIAFLGPVP